MPVMHIQFEVTADDDIQILEALKEQARSCRRRGTPQAAMTASKIELLFSKAIDKIESTTPEKAS